MRYGKRLYGQLHRVIVLALSIVLLNVATGCTIGKNTRVVFTTGFDKNELFTIGKSSGTSEELNVYMFNTMNHYVAIYGEDILYKRMNGTTLQQNIRDMSLARLVKIKIMNLLAKEYEVFLEPEEQAAAAEAAEAYYGSLAEEEIDVLKVNVALLTRMYQEYAIAEKVYDSIVADITPEISDDEARIITVSQIFFKTYYYDAKGAKQRYGTNARIDIHKRALGVQDRLLAGESFELLATEYNEAAETTVILGKGVADPEYEAAAFALGNGEMSDLIETADGYVLIKCLNAYDREKTDANKATILDEHKRKGFDAIYEKFADGLDREMNDSLWDKVTLTYHKSVTTQSFLDYYNEYMNK